MRIELKNLKVVASLSEETTCFTASLYINGAARGTVSNRGHGGSHEWSDRNAESEVHAYAQTLPPVMDFPDLFPEGLPQSAEILISELVHEADARKRLAHLLRDRVVFRTASGELRQTTKVQPAHLPAVVDRYTADPKSYTVLNAMPFDAALAIYRQH